MELNPENFFRRWKTKACAPKSTYAFISQADLNSFTSVMKKSTYWASTPFVWNSEKLRLRISNSGGHFFRFGFLIYCFVFYVSCLMWTFLRQALIQRQPLPTYLRTLFTLMGMSPFLVILYILSTKQSDICLWVNRGFNLAIRAERSFHIRGKEPLRNNTVKLLSFLMYLMSMHAVMSYAVMAFLLSLAYPRLPILLLSRIPEEYTHPTFTVIQSVSVSLVVLGLGYASLFIISVMFIFSIMALSLVPQLNLDAKHYCSQPKLRTPYYLALFSKSLSLMGAHLNSWTHHFVLPVQILITRSVQFGVFALVRHHDQFIWLNIGMMVLYLVALGGAWLLLMGVAGTLHKLSRQSLATYAWLGFRVPFTKQDKKEWKRVQKCLRPLAVRAGNFYILKPSSVLKCMLDYTRGSVRLLTALRKNKL